MTLTRRQVILAAIVATFVLVMGGVAASILIHDSESQLTCAELADKAFESLEGDSVVPYFEYMERREAQGCPTEWWEE